MILAISLAVKVRASGAPAGMSPSWNFQMAPVSVSLALPNVASCRFRTSAPWKRHRLWSCLRVDRAFASGGRGWNGSLRVAISRNRRHSRADRIRSVNPSVSSPVTSRASPASFDMAYIRDGLAPNRDSPRSVLKPLSRTPAFRGDRTGNFAPGPIGMAVTESDSSGVPNRHVRPAPSPSRNGHGLS